METRRSRRENSDSFFFCFLEKELWNMDDFFIFSAQEMFWMILVFFRPETRDVATRVLDIVYGSFCNLCALALWLVLHIFDTQCWQAQKERNSCPLVRFCFIGSCHVGVSKRFSRSISLADYCLHTFSFRLIRSLVDPTLATLVVCGPLQLFSLSSNDPRISCYLLFSIIPPWRVSSAPMACQGKCAIRTSLALGHVIFISVTQRYCHR